LFDIIRVKTNISKFAIIIENEAPITPNKGVSKKFKIIFNKAADIVIHIVCCNFFVILIPIDTMKYPLDKTVLKHRNGTTALAE
jgi:hypothetical protein